MVYKNTISLSIYVQGGRPVKRHITVCSLNCNSKQHYDSILQAVIAEFGKFFGSNKSYTLVFKGWLSNNNQGHGKSVATASYIPNKQGLEIIRKEMITYIRNNFGDIINTERYADGLPPQHIDINGDENNLAIDFGITGNWINQSTNVTYAIGGNK